MEIYSTLIVLAIIAMPILIAVGSREKPPDRVQLAEPTMQDDPTMMWRQKAMGAAVSAGESCTCRMERRSEAELFSENYRIRLREVSAGNQDPGNTAKEYRRVKSETCPVHMWDFMGEDEV